MDKIRFRSICDIRPIIEYVFGDWLFLIDSSYKKIETYPEYYYNGRGSVFTKFGDDLTDILADNKYKKYKDIINLEISKCLKEFKYKNCSEEDISSDLASFISEICPADYDVFFECFGDYISNDDLINFINEECSPGKSSEIIMHILSGRFTKEDILHLYPQKRETCYITEVSDLDAEADEDGFGFYHNYSYSDIQYFIALYNGYIEIGDYFSASYVIEHIIRGKESMDDELCECIERVFDIDSMSFYESFLENLGDIEIDKTRMVFEYIKHNLSITFTFINCLSCMPMTYEHKELIRELLFSKIDERLSYYPEDVMMEKVISLIYLGIYSFENVLSMIDNERVSKESMILYVKNYMALTNSTSIEDWVEYLCNKNKEDAQYKDKIMNLLMEKSNE